jgi:capsular polysaccharide transport system ATP-binding protein
MQRPTSGYIRRGLRMSWPLALAGGFEGELTGYDNLRFIAKLYDAPLKATYEFVDDFSELGAQLHVPTRFYSDGMRMRLAFALSLAIDFECYLIDEVLAVGDRKFQEKCHKAIFADRADRAMILAIHDMGVVRERCTSVFVLRNGRGRLFKDVDFACTMYETM